MSLLGPDVPGPSGWAVADLGIALAVLAEVLLAVTALTLWRRCAYRMYRQAHRAVTSGRGWAE